MSAKLKMPGTKRCSFSLPTKTASDLAYVSDCMGVSQSALLSQIAGDSISMMASLLRSSGSDLSSPEVIKRFRGESVQFIEKEVSQFMSTLDELDSHVRSN
jgi:cob(I)alamin adenosyltransferase